MGAPLQERVAGEGPRKRQPCPTCLACGETIYRHVICSRGPAPEHGSAACECPMCESERVSALMEAARRIDDPPLQAALAALDGVTEANRRFWDDRLTFLAKAAQGERAGAA